jgi:hypothetical protein
VLIQEGYIVQSNNRYTVSSKGLLILESLQSTTPVPVVQKTKKLELDEDAVAKYNEIFPNIKFPSGKRARAGNIRNLFPAFEWFFKNYSYSWDTIYKATGLYLDEWEPRGYKFARTAQYFIRKTEPDRSVISDLADYCANVESGEDLDGNDTHFTEKAV